MIFLVGNTHESFTEAMQNTCKLKIAEIMKKKKGGGEGLVHFILYAVFLIS